MSKIAIMALLAASAIFLSACSTIDPSDPIPQFEANLGAKCKASSTLDSVALGEALPAAMSADDRSRVQSFANQAFGLSVLVARANYVKDGLPPPLKNDVVATALLNAIENAAINAQSRANATWSLTTAQANDPTPTDLGTFDAWDMKRFAENVRLSMSNSGYAYGAHPGTHRKSLTALDAATDKDFPDYFVDYYSAYFSGGFVDRFGTKLAKPTFAHTVSDADISGAIVVFVELVSDYMLHTPVWQDKSGLYYPGSIPKANPPTAVTEKLAPVEKLVEAATPGDTSYGLQCGITALKAQAIEYLAQSAGTRASMLGGLVSGNFGGLQFGLGVLGKWSIGDNQTLQTMAKAALQSSFTRVGEESTYRILYWMPYDAALADSVADIVQNYLKATNPSAKP